MGSTSSISFRKRKDADEIYTFPYEVNQATLQIRNSVVMVEYQGDGEVLIIAGNLPGMAGYFNNYPGVKGEDKHRRHKFSNKLLENAEEFLEDYDPQRSTSTSNSGNRSMEDLYVTVQEEKQDEVVMKMWKMLNHIRDEYIGFLSDQENEEYHDYPPLEEEILEITKKCDT